MKYLLTLFYLLFFAGCCFSGDCIHNPFSDKHIFFNTFKYQGKIYTTNKKILALALPTVESNTTLYTFDSDTKKWVLIAIKDLNQTIKIFSNDYNNTEIDKLLEQDMLSIKYGYHNNLQFIYREDNTTLSNIAKKIKENYHQSDRISYMQLFKNQTEWDGVSYFINQLVGENNARYYYVVSDNNEVSIKYLTDAETLFKNSLDKVESTYINTGDIEVPSFDGKCNMQLQDKCVSENNGEFSYTTITDFYTQELLDLHDSLKFSEKVDETPTSIFDEDGNLHAFYHKDGDDYSQHYMWYGYYTKENPDKPLYEQKVYW